MKCLVLALTMALACTTANAREIALSFDDAPIPDSAMMTGSARAEKLVATLKAANVKEAVFFAVPHDLPPDAAARLKRYAAAGHLIANHTNTHLGLNESTAEEYLAEIIAADKLLRSLPNFRAWFRFPFLN